MSQNNGLEEFVGRTSYDLYHPKKSKVTEPDTTANDRNSRDGKTHYSDGSDNEESLQKILENAEEEEEREMFNSKLTSNNQSNTIVSMNFEIPQLSAFLQPQLQAIPVPASIMIPYTSRSTEAKLFAVQQARILNSSDPAVSRINLEPTVGTIIESSSQISLQASKIRVKSKEESGTKPLKCSVCQEWFFSNDKLTIHLISNHGKHHCSYCDEMFETDSVREDHEKDIHFPLECDICSASVDNLDEHYEETHDMRNCRYCGVLVKPKSYYQVHVRRKHFVNCLEALEERDVRLVGNWSQSSDPTWNFNCHLCGKERKRADILGHFFSYHRLSLMCLIVFLRTEQMLFSVQGSLAPSGVHNLYTQDTSTDDSSKTSQQSEISTSTTSDDIQNRFDCTSCTKPFTFQVPKPAHDIVCCGLTICRYCSKTFTDKDMRNLHLEEEHVSFPCSRGCDKTTNTFTRDSELQKHYNETHSEMTCHFCEDFLPNNLLNLAEHLQSKHAASSRSKALKGKDIELLKLNPKTGFYVCSLCNAVTSTMTNLDAVCKHLQYHNISLIAVLDTLESHQNTASNAPRGQANASLHGVPKSENESGEKKNKKRAMKKDKIPKKLSRVAGAKKSKANPNRHMSVENSVEENGCEERETVIKVCLKKETKRNLDDTGDLESSLEICDANDNTDVAEDLTLRPNSSCDSTTEEEEEGFGSDVVGNSSDEDEETLRDALEKMSKGDIIIENDLGEAEIDPTEIECVIDDTSDDEEYNTEDNNSDLQFEVKREQFEINENLNSNLSDIQEMDCENDVDNLDQNYRETVLKCCADKNVADKALDMIERTMEDMFHDAPKQSLEWNNHREDADEGINDGNIIETDPSSSIEEGSDSKENSNALNNHNNHKPNNKSIPQTDEVNKISNKTNMRPKAKNDVNSFEGRLKNIKPDPEQNKTAEQVFNSILKCELCTKVICVLKSPVEYVEHMKMYHKFAISAHCSKIDDASNSGSSDELENVHPVNNASEKVFQCPFCAIRSVWKTAIRQHVFETHLADCTAEQPSDSLGYRCRYCNESFWRVTERNEHQITKHDDQIFEYYKCYICSQISSSKLMLTRHLKVSHPAEPQYNAISYKCKLCLLTYPCLRLLRDHFTATHPAAMVFPCQHCSITLKNKKTLKTHLKNMHAVGRRMDCTLCGKILFSKRAHAIHYRMKHSQASKVGFRCRICHRRFDTKDDRKMHYAVDHLGESPYHCTECGKGFASKSGMYGHKQLHTGSGISKCQYCGKEFTRKDSYNEHLLIHNGPRHKCPHCPKEFVQRSNLVRHIRIHTGEKPYKCVYCDKCFSDKGACNSHIRVHTREETCSCPYCGQTFSKKQKLKYHIRKHTGEGLINCEICTKSFTNSFALKEHRLIHNRETSILCGVCGKGFNSEKYLQRHVAIVHEPQQTFNCPLCSKVFSQQTRLKSHLMTHTGVKHMKCLLCDKAYSVRKSLRRHLLEKHQVSPDHPQYKRCFYAMTHQEAGLQIPDDMSYFAAAYDDDSTTHSVPRDEEIKLQGKRSPRKSGKKPVYIDPDEKVVAKKPRRKTPTKKAAAGKNDSASHQDKPSTSKQDKKGTKTSTKKLSAEKAAGSFDDSSSGCSDDSESTEDGAKMKRGISNIVERLQKRLGPGKKKRRVEAIVETLQKSSTGSPSTNQEDSNAEPSDNDEPVLARIHSLNSPKRASVGRRNLCRKPVPERIPRKDRSDDESS